MGSVQLFEGNPLIVSGTVAIDPACCCVSFTPIFCLDCNTNTAPQVYALTLTGFTNAPIVGGKVCLDCPNFDLLYYLYTNGDFPINGECSWQSDIGIQVTPSITCNMDGSSASGVFGIAILFSLTSRTGPNGILAELTILISNGSTGGFYRSWYYNRLILSDSTIDCSAITVDFISAALQNDGVFVTEPPDWGICDWTPPATLTVVGVATP